MCGCGERAVRFHGSRAHLGVEVKAKSDITAVSARDTTDYRRACPSESSWIPITRSRLPKACMSHNFPRWFPEHVPESCSRLLRSSPLSFKFPFIHLFSYIDRLACGAVYLSIDRALSGWVWVIFLRSQLVLPTPWQHPWSDQSQTSRTSRSDLLESEASKVSSRGRTYALDGASRLVSSSLDASPSCRSVNMCASRSDKPAGLAGG